MARARRLACGQREEMQPRRGCGQRESREGQPSDDCSESELVLGDAQAALLARRVRADAVISAEMACKRRALGVALWLVPRTSDEGEPRS